MAKMTLFKLVPLMFLTFSLCNNIHKNDFQNIMESHEQKNGKHPPSIDALFDALEINEHLEIKTSISGIAPLSIFNAELGVRENEIVL